jgi:hypothetical protein
MQAIEQERKKKKPSQLLIRYYQMRLEALDELQEHLSPQDMDVVARMFDKKASFPIN